MFGFDDGGAIVLLSFLQLQKETAMSNVLITECIIILISLFDKEGYFA